MLRHCFNHFRACQALHHQYGCSQELAWEMNRYRSQRGPWELLNWPSPVHLPRKYDSKSRIQHLCFQSQMTAHTTAKTKHQRSAGGKRSCEIYHSSTWTLLKASLSISSIKQQPRIRIGTFCLSKPCKQRMASRVLNQNAWTDENNSSGDICTNKPVSFMYSEYLQWKD